MDLKVELNDINIINIEDETIHNFECNADMDCDHCIGSWLCGEE